MRPSSRDSKKSPTYPVKDRKKTSILIAIGAGIMIVSHLLYWEYEKRVAVVEEVPAVAVVEDQGGAPPVVIPHPDPVENDFSELAGDEDNPPKQAEIVTPVPLHKGVKKIVVIIDDMGVSQKLSYETLELPGPLTLAFLPYAHGLKKITNKARKNGHELMIHMPMEPMNSDLDVGAIALLDGMNEADIHEALDQAFKSFKGYVGINNHMGSRVTQNKKMMDVVMTVLAERDLLFVDSKTINTSVAGKIAEDHGLRYAERDIFLDHYETDEFVTGALARLEKVARLKGYAIAIGHPKVATIKALKEWLPTLKKKGFELVPISAVVRKGEVKANTVKKEVTANAIKTSVKPVTPQLPSQPLE